MDDMAKRLVAANELVEQAQKLVATQEQTVARMSAVGLDTARAQALLDAYRMSLRLAIQDRTAVEEAIERESKKSPERRRWP